MIINLNNIDFAKALDELIHKYDRIAEISKIQVTNHEKFKEVYFKSIRFIKGLKSIIIKELSTETSSHLQNTHFIEVNLLRQTTYYKLNTTRP